MALNIPTKQTGDQLTANELNQIVSEVNKKVDSVAGKGLSTNDFTNPEKNKLSGLPRDTYSKTELDNKLLTINGNILSKDEIQVGVFQIANAAGLISNPIYSKFSVLLNLPKLENETKDYWLSDDPLGCNIYFSVDSFIVSTGEKLKSEMFISMYEITKVYVDDNYNTKIVIRCKETTTLGLSAHLNVRYIKPYTEKLNVEITCENPIDVANVNIVFPALKYDKDTLVSFTTDDANASTFCRVWAAINGRPISNKFYHANQLEAGDIPPEIVDSTLDKTLGYTDGCGNERRFTQGVAIWPYCQTNGIIMMDKIVTDTNQYRFGYPYLQWIDVEVLLKYGVSIYYHNIGTEIFGPDTDINNVIAGLKADCLRSIEMVDRGMKILARPDGNNVYIEAAAVSDQILFSISENTPAVDILPFSNDPLYKKVGSRFFPRSSDTETEQDAIKNAFLSELAKNKEQRKWFHFCCHTVTYPWIDLLLWFNDNYGKDGDDSIWFATVDEVYEYTYTKQNTLIRKSVEGNKLKLTIYLPKGQYFYYPDFTLLLSGENIARASTITSSDNITGLSYTAKNEILMLNIAANQTYLELAEEFTSKYETTGQTIYKSDALYIIGLLKESLKEPFLNRLNADPNALSLLSISINNGALETEDRNVTVALSYKGSPTHYRIGEVSDLNTAIWTTFTGNAISYQLSDGYGNKTVYLQLKDSVTESVIRQSSIEYLQQSSEVVLTALSIEGRSSVQKGATIQLSANYTPLNTTQRGVNWSSDNDKIASINSNGLVTGVEVGNTTIKAISSANPSILSTKEISVVGVNTNIQFMIAEYGWNEYGKKDHLFDDIAQVYLNITNANDSIYIATDNKIYELQTGELLSGYSRMSADEKKSYYGLESLDNWQGAASYNPDLSDLFSTQLGYLYSGKYNASIYPVIGWNLPNGTYKVSILSSTTQADLSNTGHIKINKIEQTLPDMSFQNNKTWMVFDDIIVEDGKLAIIMWADISKKIGFNAIKVEKKI